MAADVVARYGGPIDHIYLVAFGSRSAETLRRAVARHTPEPANDKATAPAGTGTACQSCGSPSARTYDTPDGTAQLCPPCAALHDVGCP